MLLFLIVFGIKLYYSRTKNEEKSIIQQIIDLPDKNVIELKSNIPIDTCNHTINLFMHVLIYSYKKYEWEKAVISKLWRII